jgi:tetratricopeptide (TPR) repeat protein
MRDLGTRQNYKDEYVDVTGTLRKAQRQVESKRTKTGLRLLRALEPDELKLPERLRFYYLRALAHLQREDAGRALPDLDRAAALAVQLHNGDLAARIANLMGWAHYQQQRPAMALEYHHAALRAVQEQAIVDPAFSAVVYSNLGSDYWMLGDYAQAREAYREAARRLPPAAEAAQVAAVQWGLALSYFNAGQAEPARAHALRAIEACEQSAENGLLVRMRVNYAAILLKLGNADEAERQLRRALDETGEDIEVQIAARQALAEVALARNDPHAGDEEMQQALELARATKDPTVMAGVLQRTAALAEKSGDGEQARYAYTQAIALLTGTPERELLSRVLFAYAGFTLRKGCPTQAANVYEEAYRSAGPVGVREPVGYQPPVVAAFTRTPATNMERRRTRRAAPQPALNGAVH